MVKVTLTCGKHKIFFSTVRSGSAFLHMLIPYRSHIVTLICHNVNWSCNICITTCCCSLDCPSCIVSGFRSINLDGHFDALIPLPLNSTWRWQSVPVPIHCYLSMNHLMLVVLELSCQSAICYGIQFRYPCLWLSQMVCMKTYCSVHDRVDFVTSPLPSQERYDSFHAKVYSLPVFVLVRIILQLFQVTCRVTCE